MEYGFLPCNEGPKWTILKSDLESLPKAAPALLVGHKGTKRCCQKRSLIKAILSFATDNSYKREKFNRIRVDDVVTTGSRQAGGGWRLQNRLENLLVIVCMLRFENY